MEDEVSLGELYLLGWNKKNMRTSIILAAASPSKLEVLSVDVMKHV